MVALCQRARPQPDWARGALEGVVREEVPPPTPLEADVPYSGLRKRGLLHEHSSTSEGGSKDSSSKKRSQAREKDSLANGARRRGRRLTCGDTKADDVPFVPVDLERADDAEEVEVVVSWIL